MHYPLTCEKVKCGYIIGFVTLTHTQVIIVYRKVWNFLSLGLVSGISGMEWWNGLLEWNTGIDWDKIFALA